MLGATRNNQLLGIKQTNKQNKQTHITYISSTVNSGLTVGDLASLFHAPADNDQQRKDLCAEDSIDVDEDDNLDTDQA